MSIKHYRRVNNYLDLLSVIITMFFCFLNIHELRLLNGFPIFNLFFSGGLTFVSANYYIFWLRRKVEQTRIYSKLCFFAALFISLLGFDEFTTTIQYVLQFRYFVLSYFLYLLFAYSESLFSKIGFNRSLAVAFWSLTICNEVISFYSIPTFVLLIYIQVCLVAACCLYIAYLAERNSRRSTQLYIFSIFQLGLTALVSSLNLVPIELLILAFTIFNLTQTYILSTSYNNSFIKLEEGKERLEKIVGDRTAELQTAKESAENSTAEIRKLSGHLNGILEAERKSIASELHDGMGSTIVGLKMRAESVAYSLETIIEVPDEIVLLVKSMAETLELIYQKNKDLSRHLRPVILDTKGLKAGLKWLVNDFSKSIRKEITFDSDGAIENFSEELALTIFRICQESITNIIKHADAERIHIELAVLGDEVELKVTDDGVGFNMETLVMGLGLIGIRERARRLGGNFTIRSEVGVGTLLKVIFPIVYRR